MPSMIVGSASSAFAMERASGQHVQFKSGAPVDGTARSRSTSAGSSSPRSCEDALSDSNSTAGFVRLPDSVGLRLCDYPATFDEKATSELPAYDYPVPLLVRNTFIDTDVWRPSSLCDFIQQRQVQSCPGSFIGECRRLDDQLEDGFATSLPSHQTVVNNVEIQVEAVTAATLETSMEQEVSTAVSELQSSRATSALEVCCPRLGSITLLSAVSPPPPSQAPVETTAPLGPPVLGLSNSPPWPQLGSPALPTVGSASHQQGFCWPCPFYHTTGCANGVDCTFCHLCKPGEKNRRRKERLATRRAAQIRGPPPMQEVLSLFFMNPKKAKRRAGKIGGAAGTRDDAVVVTTGRTARR